MAVEFVRPATPAYVWDANKGGKNKNTHPIMQHHKGGDCGWYVNQSPGLCSW